MPKKNKLSIYLIKEEFADQDDKILKDTRSVLAELEDIGTVYYVPSVVKIPKWLDDFYCGKIISKGIYTSNARVVLIIRVNVSEKIMKTFAITMGYGKNLLETDAVENDFGIKVVLNSINNKNLRKINKTNIGGNQKTSSEQLPLAAEINEFGFDIENDLISAITGLSSDKTISEGMMSGSDLLSLSAEVDVTNIKSFLKIVYKKYCSKEYKEGFGWIDHIKKIKDDNLISRLEQRTVELIKEKSTNIWMAVPDIIEWEQVKGFKYTKEDFEYDIDICKVVESFSKGFTEFKQLKNKSITAISNEDGESTYKVWKAHKCLVGEVDLDGKIYCINNGYWYSVDKDFVKSVNDEYNTIPISDMVFMECPAGNIEENKYTMDFVKTKPDYMISMDKKNISYGGGHSKVELCDILTADGKYIHIKPYSGSATLSHLFNQSVVSAELVISDKEFVRKANEKIKEITDKEEFIIKDGQHPGVVLAIISDKDVDRPNIPFFSKVALRHTKRRLMAYNCKLEIKNIKKAKVNINNIDNYVV